MKEYSEEGVEENIFNPGLAVEFRQTFEIGFQDIEVGDIGQIGAHSPDMAESDCSQDIVRHSSHVPLKQYDDVQNVIQNSQDTQAHRDGSVVSLVRPLETTEFRDEVGRTVDGQEQLSMLAGVLH